MNTPGVHDKLFKWGAVYKNIQYLDMGGGSLFFNRNVVGRGKDAEWLGFVRCGWCTRWMNSFMILYLSFILDGTVAEWHQVRDLFWCIKTPHVMILDWRFICVKLVWFETNNERTCNDRRGGGSRWGISAREHVHGNIGPHRGMQTVRLIGYGSSLEKRLTGYENLYSSQP